MILKELASLLAISHIVGDADIKINGVQMDSRKIQPGDLFFCIKGAVFDGHNFASAVAQSGAVALVVEQQIDIDVPQLIVKNTRQAMAQVAAYFYGFPSKEMKVIGITGTNGKTTTSHIIEHILSNQSCKTGLLGTVGIKIGNLEYESARTTLESIELQRIFRKMREFETEYAIMEVSSHAIQIGRVNGVNFRTAVFTNLTQDHLDFHGTMENYKAAKGLLFSRLGNSFGPNPEDQKFAILNADDPATEDYKKLTAAQVITYGIDNPADVSAKHIKITSRGTSFTATTFNGEEHFEMKLIGKFNVYNALAAIATTLVERIPLTKIKQSLAEMTNVEGRMEVVSNGEGQQCLVLVDYAHTPDGLENALATIREFAEGRIICVFGCGGDRDRAKRPMMGSISAKYSDYVIVTSDNPRSEDPTTIMREIELGIHQTEYELIEDRRLAIQKAVEMAGSNDVVLIAGKGHETYQIIGEQTIHFDDREEAREAIERRKRQ